MKALWIDTGPLLELTAHELEKQRRGAFRRLESLLALLKNKARLARFEDCLRTEGFGQLRFSSGSLVELHSLVRRPLAPNRDKLDLLSEFWAALERVRSSMGRPVVCVPLELCRMDAGSLPRFGPVDAHLVAAVHSDEESWLFTSDAPLKGFVADRCRGRVLDVTY